MTRLLTCLWLGGCMSLCAQNFAVRLGTVADGTISNWPVQVQPIGTNTTVAPPWLLMTRIQIDQCLSTNQSAMTAWESNNAFVAKAKLDANLARIVALFQQIPAARTQMTNIQNATISNVSQASTHIKTMANVMDGILEELQRMGPVFKQIYKPEEDQ